MEIIYSYQMWSELVYFHGFCSRKLVHEIFYLSNCTIALNSTLKFNADLFFVHRWKQVICSVSVSIMKIFVSYLQCISWEMICNLQWYHGVVDSLKIYSDSCFVERKIKITLTSECFRSMHYTPKTISNFVSHHDN